MDNEYKSTSDTATKAQAAIREGIERARELVCEARAAIRQHETLKAQPPNGGHS